jgi:hypothetical protein
LTLKKLLKEILILNLGTQIASAYIAKWNTSTSTKKRSKSAKKQIKAQRNPHKTNKIDKESMTKFAWNSNQIKKVIFFR